MKREIIFTVTGDVTNFLISDGDELSRSFDLAIMYSISKTRRCVVLMDIEEERIMTSSIQNVYGGTKSSIDMEYECEGFGTIEISVVFEEGYNIIVIRY